MVVLSVLNKKGGVGKTTIATNMAQGLAIIGQKVLVIDNDEQHNLTTSLGLAVKDCPVTLADVMNTPISQLESVAATAIYEGFLENLHCVAGGRGLESINPRKSVLQDFLQTEVVQHQKYDIVIIDNSPTMSAKALAAISASNSFLLPVQLKQFSVDGLVEMYNILTQEHDVDPQNIFILRNMYRAIKVLELNSHALKVRYPDNVLDTIIPDDIAFENMICNSKSMFFSQTRSKGTLQFQRLICEIFGFDEQEMLERFKTEVEKYRAEIRKEGLKRAHIINLSIKKEVA